MIKLFIKIDCYLKYFNFIALICVYMYLQSIVNKHSNTNDEQTFHCVTYGVAGRMPPDGGMM